MSLSRLPEIPRAFAEWDSEHVLRWLASLQLSRDYTKQFRDNNIDGSILLSLNPSSLNRLGIIDRLDRVKLLQHITTMQADLASHAAPARHWGGGGGVERFRRFSENSPAYRTLAAPPRRMSIDENMSGRLLKGQHGRSRPSGYGNRSRAQSVHCVSGTPTRNPYSIAGLSHSEIGSSHSDVGMPHAKSAILHTVSRMAHSDVGPFRSHSAEGREVISVPFRRNTSPLKHRKKRLSRSMDKLWEAHLASNPLPLEENMYSKTDHRMSRYPSVGAQFHDNPALQDSVAVQLYDGPSRRSTGSVHLHSSVSGHDSGTVRLHESARLVEILREENATLKRELDTYYQRVCKLMKMEQELEKIREAHRMLEESSRRRERLEATMRARLEAELNRLRRSNHRYRQSSDLSQRESAETMTMLDPSWEESDKRATVMMTRLQLDKDMDQSTVHETQDGIETEALDSCTRNIDRLKEHLRSLQQISLRREGLERQVKAQLNAELGREEDGERKGEEENDGREGGGEEGRREGEGEEGGGGVEREGTWQTEVVALQADLAKCEQKCSALEAEKALAVEAALVKKEAVISELKQALLVREEAVSEMSQQSQAFQGQLEEAHMQITELQTSLSILQSSLAAETASPQHKSPGHQVQPSPSHSSPGHRVHSSPGHQVHSSPSHSSSPHRQLHSSPTHHLHSSPSHQQHSSPPHQIHSSPPHKLHSSPTHHLHSSPSHQQHSSPAHQIHSSPPHKLHSSPTHHLHSSPPHQLHSSPPHQTHSSPPQTSQRHRAPHHTPYVTNGGPPSTSLPPKCHYSDPPPSKSTPTRQQTNKGVTPVINSSLTLNGEDGSPTAQPPTTISPLYSGCNISSPPSPQHRVGDCTRHKSSLPSPCSRPHQPIDQSDASSSVSAPFPAPSSNCSPQHLVKGVKSKTPPPRNEVNVTPNKYYSLDQGPSTSHTPPNLQLFNSLIGDGKPGKMGRSGSGRGVKSDNHRTTEVNSMETLFPCPHSNRV